MSDVDMDAALDALETEHGIDLDPAEPEAVDVVEDEPEQESEPGTGKPLTVKNPLVKTPEVAFK